MAAILEAIKATPGFLLSCSIPPFRANTKKEKIDRLLWLDGLKGFAAMLVYLSAFIGFSHERMWEIQRAYGWNGNHHAITLPGIRIFFSGGHFAVALFFILSGYALSIQPLHYLIQRDQIRLSTHLGSALARRWVRLYYPVFCTTFIFMTSWYILNIETCNPTSDPPESSYILEVGKWISDMKNETYFFENEPFYSDHYNPHVWAIAIALRGSVIVFVTFLMALTFTAWGAGARLLGEASLIFYFLFIVDGWYFALYIMGMFLCDLDLLTEYEQLPKFPRVISILKRRTGRGSSLIYYLLLIFAIYLGGVPMIGDRGSLRENDPGWRTLALLAPAAVHVVRWFFLFWAATFAMIAIPRISWLKSFFESRICQYLGRIAFGLFLVHGPVNWTIGERLYAAVGRPRNGSVDRIPGWVNYFPLPDFGPLGLEINTLVPQIILLPFTLWLGGVVTKMFDEPGIKLSHWLFNPSRSEGYESLGAQ